MAESIIGIKGGPTHKVASRWWGRDVESRKIRLFEPRATQQEPGLIMSPHAAAAAFTRLWKVICDVVAISPVPIFTLKALHHPDRGNGLRDLIAI